MHFEGRNESIEELTNSNQNNVKLLCIEMY